MRRFLLFLCMVLLAPQTGWGQVAPIPTSGFSPLPTNTITRIAQLTPTCAAYTNPDKIPLSQIKACHTQCLQVMDIYSASSDSDKNICKNVILKAVTEENLKHMKTVSEALLDVDGAAKTLQPYLRGAPLTALGNEVLNRIEYQYMRETCDRTQSLAAAACQAKGGALLHSCNLLVVEKKGTTGAHTAPFTCDNGTSPFIGKDVNPSEKRLFSNDPNTAATTNPGSTALLAGPVILPVDNNTKNQELAQFGSGLAVTPQKRNELCRQAEEASNMAGSITEVLLPQLYTDLRDEILAHDASGTAATPAYTIADYQTTAHAAYRQVFRTTMLLKAYSAECARSKPPVVNKGGGALPGFSSDRLQTTDQENAGFAYITERFLPGFITFGFLPFIGLAAVFALVLGGFMYAMSGFNESLRERAKRIIQYTLFGVIMALLSFAIIQFVVGIDFIGL